MTEGRGPVKVVVVALPFKSAVGIQMRIHALVPELCLPHPAVTCCPLVLIF